MPAGTRSRSKWWRTGREKERRKESGTGGDTGEEEIVRRGGVTKEGIETEKEMEEIGKETEEMTIEIDDMMTEKGEKREGEEVVVTKMTCLLRKQISSELSLDCLLSNKI